MDVSSSSFKPSFVELQLNFLKYGWIVMTEGESECEETSAVDVSNLYHKSITVKMYTMSTLLVGNEIVFVSTINCTDKEMDDTLEAPDKSVEPLEARRKLNRRTIKASRAIN